MIVKLFLARRIFYTPPACALRARHVYASTWLRLCEKRVIDWTVHCTVQSTCTVYKCRKSQARIHQRSPVHRHRLLQHATQLDSWLISSSYFQPPWLHIPRRTSNLTLTDSRSPHNNTSTPKAITLTATSACLLHDLCQKLRSLLNKLVPDTIPQRDSNLNFWTVSVLPVVTYVYYD